MQASSYEDLVPVPRVALQLPVELPVPEGFDPERIETWPRIPGRLEYVEGRLLYMPPSGDAQADTCADVAGVLKAWRRSHRDFKVAGNETGILLGGSVRGADAAIWRATDLPAYAGGLRRSAPVLVVEVAGKYDEEAALRNKAAWYLQQGVAVVWLLFPTSLQVVVVTAAGDTRYGSGDRLPEHAVLPELSPTVDELFEQVREG